MSKARTREAIEGYLFLLPNLIGFLIFLAVPLCISFYYSFTDYNLFTDPKWVGLINYGKALGFSFDLPKYQTALESGKTWFFAVEKLIVPNDPIFWVALGNTIKYALGVIAFSVIPAFLIAWLLNSKLPGMPLFRAMIYIPVVASVVGSALVWGRIFQQQNGVLNTVIREIIDFLNVIIFTPIGKPIVDPMIGWLVSPKWALFSLIIMTSWATIGYDMVIFLAALQNIPGHLFESAMVDGASKWQILRKIVIPLMTPTIFFVLVTNTISSLQIFSEPFIMTLGGPANSTLTIVYYLYQKGFQRFQMGYGASLAWIVFGLIFIVTIIQFRVSKRWVYEE
jgi:multiple sugar transport system permease protein